MKVAAGYPIGVAVTTHYHLSVGYGPHFPRLVIAARHGDHFLRMHSDTFCCCCFILLHICVVVLCQALTV